MNYPRASHILVKHEYEAVDLQRALASGKSFEDLAMKFSSCSSAPSGGDLGLIKPGKTVEEFEEALMSLKISEVSKPIRTRFGYHLIKRTE
jgi:peptidyl-prolyl cis-trans isomerase C